MKKIWQKTKDIEMNTIVEHFLSSDDIVFDKALAQYDVLGSLAHIEGLLDAGIINQEEYQMMKSGLQKILNSAKKNEIVITIEDEDIHTVVEKMLKQKIGAVADKLHTLRSRNDQVAVDMKLYCKQQLLDTMQNVLKLAVGFNAFAIKNKDIPMPGYSHMQKAMVSSVGLWAQSFSASLMDDFTSLMNAYTLNDQSPLGSAAGYGVPISINRNITAKALGFSEVQENALYCQNSRGKTEMAIVHGLLQVMHTINKFASDTLLFTMSEFQYFKLPDSFLTGSSIMAQKKNYDVLEMLRSQYAAVASHFQHIATLIDSLPSGYNRDFQEIKEPLFSSFKASHKSLAVSLEVVKVLQPNTEKLESSITSDILVTNEVYALVKQGIPFREAYQHIGSEYMKGELVPKHNIVLPEINVTALNGQFEKFSIFVNKESDAQNKCMQKLCK